jgi:hypothetical protein
MLARKQRCEGVEIARFVRRDEAPEQGCLFRGRRIRWFVGLPSRRAALPCALKEGVHGNDGRLEKLGRLGRCPSEHVDQDQRSALLRGEKLQRRDEGEADALPHRDTRLRPLRNVVRLEERVRSGFDPEALVRRWTQPSISARRASDLVRERSPTAGPEYVEAGVGRDLVEPSPRGPGRPDLILTLPSSNQALLDDLLRILKRAEHSVAVNGDGAAMRLEQRPERLLFYARRHETKLSEGAFGGR